MTPTGVALDAEYHHGIIGKASQFTATIKKRLDLVFEPAVQRHIQIDIRQQRRENASLRRKRRPYEQRHREPME